VDKVELACHNKNNFYLILACVDVILGNIFSFHRQKLIEIAVYMRLFFKLFLGAFDVVYPVVINIHRVVMTE
jgi:hypothetical protein